MKLAHTMLRTGSPEEMIKFYQDAFGFELQEKKEMDTFTLYFLRSPQQTAEIELTYNHGEDDRYEKGEGFGHIAIQTDEDQPLEDAYKQAVQAGVEDYRPPEECPGDYAFVKDSKLLRSFCVSRKSPIFEDPEGYEVEILARSA